MALTAIVNRLPGFVQLAAHVMLDHLVYSDHADGVDESVKVDRYRAAFTGHRVLWPLHGKGHPAVGTDELHPASLDPEDLHAYIHECAEACKEACVVPVSLVCGSRAVQRYHLPGPHAEVFPFSK